jgi:two-component system chemotaxis sensor kinase CheA
MGASQHRNPGSTVLLVDDSAFFREMLTPVLRAAGHRVRTAASADEALHVLLRGSIDVLVVDLELPDRPGIELVEALRRHAPTASLPVVALTAGPDQTLSEKAAGLGVVKTVSKFDRSGLIAALAKVASEPACELAA